MVAFKIEVYENGELMKTAWAFYTISVPHFARDDYITFDVTKFVYRGETFSKEKPEEAY